MNNLLSKKDIIAFNKEVGENGQFSNESSLDYALNIAKTKKNLLYELSYMVRSLLVDHVFMDGNKRTAYLVATYSLESSGYKFEKEDLVAVVKRIAEKNITHPTRIMRLIYHVIKKENN